MEDHVFQFLTIISTIAMVTVVPLIIYIWRNAMGRIANLERKEAEKITKDEVEKYEDRLTRVEDRMLAEFSKVNERMDKIFEFLTLSKPTVRRRR